MDELQAELQEFHSLGRVHQPCHKPLSEELESKSPGMESDPGNASTVPGEPITEPELHLSGTTIRTSSFCIETKKTRVTGFLLCRYWCGGGSALQHEPGGRDDVGAPEGATPSGSGGFAKSAGKQGWWSKSLFIYFYISILLGRAERRIDARSNFSH